jgi:hypothetical protein
MEQDVPHLAMVLENPARYRRRVVGFFDEWLFKKKQVRSDFAPAMKSQSGGV